MSNSFYVTEQSRITFAEDSSSVYDASVTPVLLVGQLADIRGLPWEYVNKKLSIVTEQIWRAAIERLNPMDSVPLYLNTAHVAALPTRCSRHNSPTQARALSKITRSFVANNSPEQVIVIVCPYKYALASSCAVARSLPQFSAKSSSSSPSPSPVANAVLTAANNGNHSNQHQKHVRIEFFCYHQPHPTGGNGSSYLNHEVMELSRSDRLCLESACVGVRLAAQIVDMPCNLMNTDAFVDEVIRVGNELGIQANIISGEQLQAAGFGGIYGVGRAASHPPALASLSYFPKSPDEKTPNIALVGKGIVFDTGGLCIKTKTSMPGMKRDCGGAAAVLGAFYAAVKSGFNANLHAVLCLAENAVSATATRPDDIHRLYSGKTVEINNTDAEGRLVLADGVYYAYKDLGANIILDMATLTGAQGIATGKYHGALLTNSEEWETICVEAGKNSGDMVHPIPYCPELHFNEFTSAVADMKNSVADRSNAQPSCAGLFIGAQLGFDFQGSWIHLDMASPVHCGERATGYGVGFLLSLFGYFSSEELLKRVAPHGVHKLMELSPVKKARKE